MNCIICKSYHNTGDHVYSINQFPSIYAKWVSYPDKKAIVYIHCRSKQNSSNHKKEFEPVPYSWVGWKEENSALAGGSWLAMPFSSSSSGGSSL